MERLLQDLRYAARRLIRSPGFTAGVLLTLSVCIGANLTIFSVVNAVLFRPLPYDDPGRLVVMYNSYPAAGTVQGSNSAVDYFLRRERIDAFEEVAAYVGSGHTVGDAGSTERVETMRVTPSFFPLLGVEPMLGRTFAEDEISQGQTGRVVITHGFWQEHFAGAPDVVGRTLRVDGRPHAVVGVLPEEFRFVGRPDTRFFVPLAFTPEERTLESWHNNNYQMMARLQPGATLEQARAQIDAMNASLLDDWPVPNGRQLLEDAGFHTLIVGARDDLLREIRPTLFLLWAGVGFVLLIGCVNIANLMLIRTNTRVRELAMRLVLGARRTRLVRQILTEAVVIGLLGGVLGIGLAALALQLVGGIWLEELPRGAEVALNTPTLLFAFVLTLAASTLFGSIPAAYLLRDEFTGVYRGDDRTSTAGRKSVLIRSGLITAQVAIAFVLLVGAALMVRSFRAANSVDPGFEPEGVLTALVSLPEARYPDADSRRRFADELLGQLQTIPGVQSASATSQLPFSGDYSSSTVLPVSYEPRAGESILSPFQTIVGPGYFETMGMRVLAGRAFLESDAPERPNVMVIDEWLARRYWPNSSPIGQRMVYGVNPEADDVDESDVYTVIGVVESIKQNDLTASEQVGAYYFNYRQLPTFGYLTLVLRTGLAPKRITAEVRQALTRIDPELPLYGVQTLEARVAESLVSRRTTMLLLLAFASAALFLAVTGIYAVLAYSVTQRTRELGIRMALGGTPATLFRQVAAQGLRVTALGLALGTLAALELVQFIRSLLFGVRPIDPGVLAAVALLLFVAAAAACAVPARRATRVDPMVALRAE